MAAFAFAGLLDALYLTVTHYSGADIACGILEGCDEVAQSKYSMVFGIPLALLGLFYYFSVLLSLLLYFDTKKSIFAEFVIPVSAFGFLFSIYLTYLQIWVIEALCIYCISSAVSSTLLFIFSMIMLFRYKKPTS
ncbi:vitamin K epoxide reductase family protein [Candidatus Peregrinibacteria bacterium]|jgi:uncharacterized membrane protein|nr:vitamin K epoxide reductase family protein [Candidatus Peregrinibacteria bacterium]